MRVEQIKGEKGSLKWIQTVVNEFPEVINSQVKSKFSWDDETNFEWVSPLINDQYAEYRDSSFIERLGIKLEERALNSFWPSRGPQWDALCKTDNGVLLVEAKANIPEFISPASGASEKSLEIIKASFRETQQYLEINTEYEWTNKFYQYANRFAHLYFLNVVNRIPSYLIFVDFIGATEVNGPKYIEEWQAVTTVAENMLGIPKRHKLRNNVAHIYIDTNEIKDMA